MIEFLNQKYLSGSIKGKRATALQPIAWMLIVCLGGLLSAVRLQVPSWLISVLAGLCVLVVLTALGAFGYLLVVDRDALRSEHFNITKMQIEKGVMGDSISGLTSSLGLSRHQARKLEQAGNGE